MIITCQSCRTQFYLTNQALAPSGKKVKCGSCKAVWFQEYVDAPKVKLSKLKALDSKAIFLPAVIKKKSSVWGLLFAVSLFFMMVGTGFASFHALFLERYFNTSKLYDKLGGYSMKSVKVRALEIAQKTESQIDINGIMENSSSGDERVPSVRLLLFDENKKLIKSLVVPAPPRYLSAGSKYSFYRKLEGDFKTKPKLVVATFATRTDVLLDSLDLR
jgi:predicted Zn finger-like uncharacterized protein